MVTVVVVSVTRGALALVELLLANTVRMVLAPRRTRASQRSSGNSV